MHLRDKSIDEKIEWLLGVNEKHSKLFVETRIDRQLYRENHPTEICAFKCMDGRINIPLMTNTPLGIIKPYRNLGGIFDLGWKLLGLDLMNWVQYGVTKRRKSLIMITYHYSMGDKHRGCKGCNYDTPAAVALTLNLYKQVRRVFGMNSSVVYPIVVGIETDTDAFILHPQDPTDKNLVYLSGEMSADRNFVVGLINDLYPDMDTNIKNDLLPLLQGNIAHIKEVKASNRHLDDMNHREWVIGVGQGFDWLHEANTVLLVGPWDQDMSNAINKALGIIADNMKSKRSKDDGFLVLNSTTFREVGIDQNRATEGANLYRKYVRKIIKESYPELLPKARFLSVTVDENTRKLNLVSEME